MICSYTIAIHCQKDIEGAGEQLWWCASLYRHSS